MPIAEPELLTRSATQHATVSSHCHCSPFAQAQGSSTWLVSQDWYWALPGRLLAAAVKRAMCRSTAAAAGVWESQSSCRVGSRGGDIEAAACQTQRCHFRWRLRCSNLTTSHMPPWHCQLGAA